MREAHSSLGLAGQGSDSHWSFLSPSTHALPDPGFGKIPGCEVTDASAFGRATFRNSPYRELLRRHPTVHRSAGERRQRLFLLPCGLPRTDDGAGPSAFAGVGIGSRSGLSGFRARPQPQRTLPSVGHRGGHRAVLVPVDRDLARAATALSLFQGQGGPGGGSEPRALRIPGTDGRRHPESSTPTSCRSARTRSSTSRSPKTSPVLFTPPTESRFSPFPNR